MNRDHEVYRLEIDPLEPIWTTISHGERDLRAPLVAKVRKQLMLKSKRQLEDYVQCRVSKRDYLCHLVSAGLIPSDAADCLEPE